MLSRRVQGDIGQEGKGREGERGVVDRVCGPASRVRRGSARSGPRVLALGPRLLTLVRLLGAGRGVGERTWEPWIPERRVVNGS
jgi:hypothetical protein